MTQRIKKGSRLYRCGDCAHRLFVEPRAFDRASRPRCHRCGCTFLEPVSDGAAENEIKHGTARAIADHAPPHDPRANVTMRGERSIGQEDGRNG